MSCCLCSELQEKVKQAPEEVRCTVLASFSTGMQASESGAGWNRVPRPRSDRECIPEDTESARASCLPKPAHSCKKANPPGQKTSKHGHRRSVHIPHNSTCEGNTAGATDFTSCSWAPATKRVACDQVMTARVSSCSLPEACMKSASEWTALTGTPPHRTGPPCE